VQRKGKNKAKVHNNDRSVNRLVQGRGPERTNGSKHKKKKVQTKRWVWAVNLLQAHKGWTGSKNKRVGEGCLGDSTSEARLKVREKQARGAGAELGRIKGIDILGYLRKHFREAPTQREGRDPIY